MRRIEAVIRPDRTDSVKKALKAIGHNGVTIVSARGHGVEGGLRQKWRLKDYVVDLIPKTMVIVIVKDSELETAIEAISTAARTDMIGDGKIFVSEVAEAVRIRTGERGAQVL